MRSRRPPKPKRIQPPDNASDGNPFSIKWPQKGGDKLVGAYIPQQDADYLALLAVYRTTTLSDLMRQAVQKLIEEGEPEEFLIQNMVSRAGNEWKTRLKENQGESGWLDRVDVLARFREYQHELRLLLIKRSVSEKLIMRIIKKMETMYGVGGI